MAMGHVALAVLKINFILKPYFQRGRRWEFIFVYFTTVSVLHERQHDRWSRGLIEVLFSWRDVGKLRKASVRIFGVPTEI
jgi:hypothetical protein